MELGSSGLYLKHFIHRAISLAQEAAIELSSGGSSVSKVMDLFEQRCHSKDALGQKGRRHSNDQGMADGSAWPAAGLQEGQHPRAVKECRETRLS